MDLVGLALAEPNASTDPHHVLVAFSRDASARAAYTKQATEDWRNFLLS